MNTPAHNPYFWLSLTGAIGMAVLFGLGLPTLFVRIVREVSWAHMTRSAVLLVISWLVSVGMAWGFDAYCQWWGLSNQLSVMVFLCFLFWATLTAVGFRFYQRLNNVTSRSEQRKAQRLLHAVEEVSRNGVFVSRPSDDDPSTWLVFSANRAACQALGYAYRSLFDNDLVGLSGADLVPVPHLNTAREHAARPEKSEYMMQLLCRDGRRHWVEMAGQTLPRFDGGPVRVSCFNVVTEFVKELHDTQDRLLLATSLKSFTKEVERIVHEPV